MEPCHQRISLPQAFFKCFEGAASSHDGEDAIDRHSTCQIPLSPKTDLHYMERETLSFSTAYCPWKAVVKLLAPQRYFSPFGHEWCFKDMRLLLHMHLQIHKQAWADTHQKECTSDRHGCPRDLWTWKEEEESLLLWIMSKDCYSYVPLRYVTIDDLSNKDRKSYIWTNAEVPQEVMKAA